jgi:hypothetical protein
MKIALHHTFAVLSGGVLLLTSCTPDLMDEGAEAGRPRYGYMGTEQVGSTQYQTQYQDTAPSSVTTTTTTTTSSTPEPTPQPSPSVDPAPAVVEKKDYPYGTPVQGKPGFVTSPHAPYSGYVDVRGFPPGTEVKDPYTGKIFLVP